MSARPGESEDITIVHMAVAWGAKQLNVGPFLRSGRIAKCNEGLRIAEPSNKMEGSVRRVPNFPEGVAQDN